MGSDGLRKRIVTGVGLAVAFLTLDILASYHPAFRMVLAAFALLAVAVCGVEVGGFSSSGSLVARALTAFVFLFPAFTVFLNLTASGLAGARPPSIASGFSAGVALGFLLLSFIIFLQTRIDLDAAVKKNLTLLTGFLLVGLGGGSFLSILLLETGGKLVGWLVAVVAACDTSAFFVGRAIGGPKLSPAVSPGKTLSGSFGGLVAASLVGTLLGWLLGVGSLSALSLGLGFAVALSSQLGDLMKSSVKRVWGVKDSGAILPGHGGVFDRIDGILGGAVFLWAAICLGVV